MLRARTCVVTALLLVVALGLAISPEGLAAEAKGVALTIGLNSIDPHHYGSDGRLYACENDARDMAEIAEGKGFEVTTLLTREAKRQPVLDAIAAAADELESGDIFMISYSGHGGQVHDFSGDERENGPSDTLDETWCLYDGQVIDDELRAAYGQFAEGVRVLVFSDSCHSGTVTKEADYQRIARSGIAQTPERQAAMGWGSPDAPGGKGGDLGAMFSEFMKDPKKKRGPVRARPRVPTTRNLPLQVAFQAFARNREYYEEIANGVNAGDRSPVAACVLLISGCQDNQFSSDGWVNGLFTGTLLRVWGDGAFSGDYRAFHHSIQMELPPTQSPNYYVTGAHNPDFEAQRPFTVATGP